MQIFSAKPRAEAGRLLLKNPTMDDIMNAIADVAKDNEEGEEIRCTARVYRADELTEEQRRKYDQFAVNGVYSENYESQEQTKPKKKKKNKKKKVPSEESEESMGAAAFVDEGIFFFSTIRVFPLCTKLAMLIFLYCIYLKISKIEKSVTLI